MAAFTAADIPGMTGRTAIVTGAMASPGSASSCTGMAEHRLVVAAYRFQAGAGVA